MANRQGKIGLDYFPLDCHMEDKVRLIQAEFGLAGFAIIIKLFQKIYGQFGYYCDWDNDVQLLFMSENAIASSERWLVSDVVSACIGRGIFSETLFNEYGILTSAGIQRRYLTITSERKQVVLRDEYRLIDNKKSKMEDDEENLNPPILSLNRPIDESQKVDQSILTLNPPILDDNRPTLQQRKVNKIKEKEIKEKEKEKVKTFCSERLVEEQEKPLCTEPDKPSPVPAAKLLLNDKTEYMVFQAEVDEWQEIYPAVDVAGELRKMVGWCIGNPQKRKTRRGIKRFINQWLSREQDNGGNLRSGSKGKEEFGGFLNG